jgi:putative hydrolase of the HAD superfamily
VAGARGILFDFGGTLDGAGLSWTDRFLVVYRRLGLEVPSDRVVAAAGHGTRNAYAEPALASASLRETVDFHVRCQLRFLALEQPALRAGLVDAFVADSEAALAASRRWLASLVGRVALGVVSNFYGNLERILVDAEMATLFGAIVDSAVVGVSKPDAEIFSLALARLGLAPGEALFVGDSLEKDVLPARECGLRSVLLAPGERTCELPPGVERVAALADVERLIEIPSAA